LGCLRKLKKEKTMLFSKNSGGVSYILLCLGNPGDQYENTRHNVGFLVADEIAQRQNAPIQKLKFKALTNILTISGEKVLVMKPVTYMNLSGEAVRPAADFYKIPPEKILVVSDDTALPVGKLRIRKGGSAGGHNGLKNIIQQLGTDQFPRIRVGVGEKPHPDYDLADWVLGKFQGEDKKAIDAAVKRAADAVECIIQEGLDRGMNKFN
jgi:PTH1 family peptidyl-tRNA hydrolase